MNLLNQYAWSSADDIHEFIDKPFFDKFDDNTGILEGLERIRADKYQVENNLGLTKTVKHMDDMGNVSEAQVPKATIGLNDLMDNAILGESSLGVPSFTEIFESQFEQLQALGMDDFESVGDYITHLVSRGNITHTPDHWLNGLSNVLDTVGVVSTFAAFTGRNILTRELLTDEEKSAANLDAVLNVGLLGLTVLSGGLGAKSYGARAVVKAGSSRCSYIRYFRCKPSLI